MKLRALVLVVLTSVAGSAPTWAEPHHHDGLYLRLGAGGGYTFGTLTSAADSDSHGVNVATELAIGKNLRPGLILGVGTFPMVAPAPSYDGVSAGGQHVSGTGPFVDYYLAPSGGLHVQGGVLFTAGYLDGSAARDGVVGVGVGATAGVGFDRFVSAEWSVGVLARVTAYRLYGVDDSISLLSPSLLVTATYD